MTAVLHLMQVRIRPQKGKPIPGAAMLDLQNFRLSLHHGRPSQQLLTSCFLDGLDAGICKTCF